MDLILAFSLDTVRLWVQQQGFWGGVAIVFALLFACGLGLPLPEDIPLIVSGALLISDPQSAVVVGAACWSGIIGGDICLYFLGRKYGLNVSRLPLVGKHVTPTRIANVQRLFEQYGVWVIAVGRLFAGIRGAMVVTAGAIRYNFWKFLIADGFAAVVSGGLFILLGHWIGRALDDQKIRQFKHWFLAGALVLAVLVVAWIVWRRRTGGETVAQRIEHPLEARLAPHPDPHPTCPATPPTIPAPNPAPAPPP